MKNSHLLHIKNIFLLTWLTCVLSVFTLHSINAQSAAMPVNNNADAPLEISADQTLEWHQNEQKYIARGNVVVVQGDVTIKTDLLVADYRKVQGNNFDIHKLTATGNVAITSGQSSVYGDLAIYNVANGLAEMTGNNLKMTSATDRLTAKDKFIYNVNTGKLDAIGDVTIHSAEDTLQSEKMTAYLEEDTNGKRSLSKAIAIGKVIITTAEEKLTGSQGTYDAKTNMAEITGDVVITRGPNSLHGKKAEINLTTNVSKMYGNETGNGRVKGVFYPGRDAGLSEIVSPDN